MTTPNPLASLPKKWRRTAALVDAQKQDRAYPSGEPYEDCARELEAALDALVERLESFERLENAEGFSRQSVKAQLRSEIYSEVVAELRGRVVSE